MICHAYGMVKPKKKRTGDSAQIAYGVVQDAIRLKFIF